MNKQHFLKACFELWTGSLLEIFPLEHYILSK